MTQENIKFSNIYQLSVSDKLREFIYRGPFTRPTIFSFLKFASSQFSKGDKIIDVGSGDAPYRELFEKNFRYFTSDFKDNIYHRKTKHNFICSSDKIPVDNNYFDGIICTEMLEHTSKPFSTLREFKRILKKNGKLFITTPLVIQPHEIPYDFFRYTEFFYKKFLPKYGFRIIKIYKRGGVFSTILNVVLSFLFIKNHSQKNRSKFGFLVKSIIGFLVKMGTFLDKKFDKNQLYHYGYAVYAIKNPKKL